MANGQTIYPTAEEALGLQGAAQGFTNVVESTAGGAGSLNRDLQLGGTVSGSPSDATRQLIEEAILTQAGRSDLAQQVAQQGIEARAAVSADEAANQYDSLTGDLANLEAANAGDMTTALTSQIPGYGLDFGSFEGIGLEEPDYSAQEALIKQKQELNQEQLDSQIQAIRDQYASERMKQERINLEQLGSTRNLLAATGASTFASGKGAVTKEIQRGQDAMNRLTALENQAIQAAKMAAQGQDIALLQESINLAQQAHQAKNDIRQQQFSNFLQMSQEARAQAGFAGDRFSMLTELMGGMSSEQLANMDTTSLSNLETQLGLPPGSAMAYAQNQIQQQQQAEAIDNFNRVLELGGLGALTPDQMTEYATALGVPTEVLNQAAQYASSPATEIKTVGGALLSVTQNPDGTVDVQTLFDGSAGRGGGSGRAGGGGGGSTGKIGQWVNLVNAGAVTSADIEAAVANEELTILEAREIELRVAQTLGNLSEEEAQELQQVTEENIETEASSPFTTAAGGGGTAPFSSLFQGIGGQSMLNQDGSMESGSFTPEQMESYQNLQNLGIL